MFTINAEACKKQDKGTSRRPRAINKLPATIYGGKEAPLATKLDYDKAMNMQVRVKFYSGVLTIIVDGKEIKAKAQGIQRHPHKPRPLHIDFVHA